jgi:hypothetical protein
LLNDGKETSGRAASVKAHRKGAMGRALGRGREREEGDPAKRLSLWAGHGSVGALGVGDVAMGKRIVAMGAVALGGLTHRGSARVESQHEDRRGRACVLGLTMQATGIAQPGMLSLQKPKTSVRAVISKGIKRAS